MLRVADIKVHECNRMYVKNVCACTQLKHSVINVISGHGHQHFLTRWPSQGRRTYMERPLKCDKNNAHINSVF